MKSKEKPKFNSSAFDFKTHGDVKSAPPAHHFYCFRRRVMETLVTILVVVAVIWQIAILIRSLGASQKPTYATRDQLPSIVSKLQRTGRDGSFVVFMFSIPAHASFGDTLRVRNPLRGRLPGTRCGWPGLLRDRRR